MTPEEAKAKWCPFAHPVPLQAPNGSYPVPGGNRAYTYEAPANRYVHDMTRCFADRCMMWTGDDCGLKQRK
jgi:hypothetical protein